jgi:hypothetical protein
MQGGISASTRIKTAQNAAIFNPDRVFDVVIFLKVGMLSAMILTVTALELPDDLKQN